MARAKTTAKKATAKKPSASKAAAKKAPAKTAKKTAAKKTAAKTVKKAAAKTAGKTASAKKPAAKKPAAKKPAAKKPAAKKPAAKTRRLESPELFARLSEGERADALRILLEDIRLASMAKVGRYRVIACEPLAVKPTHPEAGQRFVRVVIYDYSADRCVEASVNLDSYAISHLSINQSQPMLSAEEELAAMDIALASDRVRAELSLGEVAQAAMHYWSHRPADLAHNRRSAAVLLGEPGARPSLIAVVDLLDAQVSEVVPADKW